MAFQQKVLKECTKILLEIENENNGDKELECDEFEGILQQRYLLYKQRKQYKNMEVLAMHEFVALCSITAERKSIANKPFLFEKTKLSFTIMCSNCDANHQPIVNLKQFEKWATKLYPLATKQNYKRIFLALASDSSSNSEDKEDLRKHETGAGVGAGDDDSSAARKGSFGRLRQRVAEYNKKTTSSSSLKEANTSKHDLIVYGGITMNRFCGYVSELFTNFNIEQNECQTVKLSLEQNISKHERILYHIRGVSDMTGLPPYYGFVILTDAHLIFQGTALTTRTTAIKLNDCKLAIERAKIGGFLKRDTALRVCCDSGTFTWNVVNIKSVRRDQLYWSIWTMIKAHELAENVGIILAENNQRNHENQSNATISDELIMKIKRKIIVEAANDVLRQNSLQNLLINKKNKFDAVPFVRYATSSLKKEYVLNICSELRAIEYEENASKSVMSSIFTTMFTDMEEEKSNKYIDPDNEIKLQNYKQLKNDFERENKAKKMDALVDTKREEFELKEFFKYLKILRIELEPLMFFYRMYKCIVGWKNKGLSLLIMIFLQLIAYFDFVHYLPAIILILNGVLLVCMKNDMEYTLHCFDSALIYCGFDPQEFDQEKLAAENYANQKYSIKDIEKVKKNKWSIMHKLKVARYKFYYNRFTMGFHQKKIKVLSIFLGRFRTIYKWQKIEKSQIFCLISIFIGCFLIITPLRYVFAIVVFALFFKHSPFKRHNNNNNYKKKGIIDTYIESIPPDIPQVDSESDNEDSDDSDYSAQKSSDNDVNE